MKIEWLGYHSIYAERVVSRAILRRQMRRKHENLAAKGRSANSSHQFDSGHSWNVVVGDEQIERTTFEDERGERLRAVVHDFDFMTIAFQGERDRERDGPLVFR